MKILHITEKPRFSGAEILIRDLAISHIEKTNIAIASLNPTEADFEETMQTLEKKGIQLFIPSHSLLRLQRLTYLFKVFKDYQPDIVVGHSAIVSVYMRIVGVFFPRIKKIVVLHAVADYEGDRKLQKAEYILQYLTNYVIAVSDWSADIYRKRFKHVACKTIYNGVDLVKFNNENSSYREIVRKNIFKIDDTAFVILQVGRINKVKNQLLTLQAISMLDENTKENILIVFAGIIEDKKYYQEIVRFCDDNRLTVKVLFLGARSDVNKLLYAADLYVMPSVRENFSIAILEAMSTGIPIIYSDIQQFNFLEKCHYENTYKFKLDDIRMFSDIIEKVFIEKIPFTFRNIDEFSFEECSKRYLNLFEEVTK